MKSHLKSITPQKRNLLKSTADTLKFLLVTERDPSHIYWMLGVITLCGMALRLFWINRPIGYDEAYTFISFASRQFKYILADYHVPNNHILNSLLIGIAYRILGSHTWIVRLPAIIASVLIIPASYFTARKFFSRNQALAVSAVLAIYPSFVHSTANGRGYMLVILFSFVLANIAGLLIKKQNLTALLAYAITGALGFYSIPIFLYPMAGISLWVAVTYLIINEPWRDRMSKLAIFLGACLVSGLLTLILYSPVIIFGTGLNSILNNDIVKSRDWSSFIESLNPRIIKIQEDWKKDLPLSIQYLLSGGFFISLIFYRKASKQKLPLQLFLFLAIAILLVLQRIAPLPRIWMYLELFCVFFSVAGLAWVVEMLFIKMAKETFFNRIFPMAALLFTIAILVNSAVNTQNPSAIADQTVQPEQVAAEYIASHLKTGDIILATGPVDMLTAYHLKILGVSYDIFYQRKHPLEFQNALVVLRVKGNFNTPEKLIESYDLLSKLDPSEAELVFEYGDLQVYSIQSRQP